MEEEMQAANVGEQTPVESAPTEETEIPEEQSSEKTPNTESEVIEKTVPLSALQEERQRRKDAEALLKNVQARYQPQTEEEVETDPRDPSQYVTRQELEYERKMAREWDEAERLVPEGFDKNKILEYAESKREQAIMGMGKYLSPAQAVSVVLDDFKAMRAEGQKSAQESVEIQKMGQLESSGAKLDSKASRLNELRNTIATSKDAKAVEMATMELLKKNLL